MRITRQFILADNNIYYDLEFNFCTAFNPEPEIGLRAGFIERLFGVSSNKINLTIATKNPRQKGWMRIEKPIGSSFCTVYPSNKQVEIQLILERTIKFMLKHDLDGKPIWVKFTPVFPLAEDHV